MGSCLGGVAAAENVTRFAQVLHVPARYGAHDSPYLYDHLSPARLPLRCAGNVCMYWASSSRPSTGKVDVGASRSVSLEATGAGRRFIHSLPGTHMQPVFERVRERDTEREPAPLRRSSGLQGNGRLTYVSHHQPTDCSKHVE